ncbi:hypothetical protein ACFSQ7_20030 [Paenibacillus rhizoplanae]
MPAVLKELLVVKAALRGEHRRRFFCTAGDAGPGDEAGDAAAD